MFAATMAALALTLSGPCCPRAALDVRDLRLFATLQMQGVGPPGVVIPPTPPTCTDGQLDLACAAALTFVTVL